MKNSRTIILALALCLAGVSQLEAQTPPWVFGIGTGLARMSSEGTQGFNTNAVGPVEAPFDLSPDDFKDLMESGFGVATFLTNGTWMIKASVGQLKLGGDGVGTLQDGRQFSASAGFDITVAEASVGYTLYRSPANKFAFGSHVGALYTKHELSLDVSVADAGGPSNLSGATEESWTDFLVGTSFDISLAPKLGWGTVLDVGFGGSNGSFKAASALSWQVRPHIALSPNVSFSTTDFENGTKGDADWYLYDADDTTVGLAVMFIF